MPVETIDDPSICLKPNTKLIDFVWKYISDVNDAPPGIVTLKKSNKKCNDVLLKLSDINWLNNYLQEYRKTTDKKVYLHEILEDVDVILPTPKITPRNPELEARIQKLTAQQNAREYKAMTKSIDSTRKDLPEDTLAYQMKQINKQLIAVAQFIFSVLAGFAFGFVGVELIVGNLDFGFRLLLGIICALVIALAEIYFLAIKLNEDCYDVFSTPKPTKLHQE
ncbi:transmembrane protein 199 [Vespa velutina]|uniref:transmembrane protein 199 n=1 Tax=Vespa velutina TaxID=202808 RepID=UPI001FB207BB|nr:transmembrane protein 199 [Vespa velutina]XP_047348531.1 transmembrane protein 199 [Vespa velutina]